MSTKRKTELAERQARLAQIKARQRKAERKRDAIIVSVAGVLVVGLVGATVAVIVGENARNSEIESQASAPIDGVETFTELTSNHVVTQVDYAQNPPVGGDHAPAWQNCGLYPEPIGDVNGVHSLEHGAVWITYDPNLAADEVEILRAVTEENNYVLVSARAGLPAPLVASAWGIQLQLDSASDARLAPFLSAYVRGPQSLEPGAPCSSGIGTPA